MIKNYFKIAWRNLWRHKQMSAINIFGLSVGMAATVLIALWVQNELSFDNYYPDANRIYRITNNTVPKTGDPFAAEVCQYVLGDHAQHEIPEVEGVARLTGNYGMTLKYNDEIYTDEKSAYVDSNWFNMFQNKFVQGSAQAFLKDPFGVVLTETAAKRYFGKGESDAIGKIFKVDTVNYQVRGVIANPPANSSLQYDLYLSTAARFSNPRSRNNDLGWNNANYVTFLKLNDHANIKQVQDKLTGILNRNVKPSEGTNKFFTLINISDMHFETDVTWSSLPHGNRTTVKIFTILGLLLLITACINYVNLTTARASIRSKEVSVRKIVGAGRWNLFGQFMSESFLVSAISVLLAVVLVQTFMPWFRQFTQKDFVNPITSSLAWMIIGGTLLVSFVLNGIYPAVMLSSFKPLNIFRGKNVLNFKDGVLRKGLVVTQFTISVVLIIGTIVIYTQLRYVEKIDPGYNRSQVFTVSLPYKFLGNDNAQWPAKVATVKAELMRSAAINNIATATDRLVNNGNTSNGGFDWPGRPSDFNLKFTRFEADHNFQKLMGLKLTDGRWFYDNGTDAKNVVLNETAVAAMNLRKPYIGQRIVHSGDTGVLVGVVKDFHYKSLHDTIGPVIIANYTATTLYIKTRAGHNQAAIVAAGKFWKQFINDKPFKYDFLDDDYNALYKAEQQSSQLITLFAVIAIVVSALGLLGLSAFAAEQKVKEIGIRKVLGATIQNIVSMLSVDFIKMVVIACLVAFPIAWWAMNKWLQAFAYRINVYWWILALSGAIALLIAFVTISLQSIKAASVNPVKSLRSE